MSNQASADDYLKCVGQLVQKAAVSDAVLFSAFVHLSGCDVDASRAIYYTLESTPTKRKLLRRIAALKNDEEINSLVDELGDAVQSAHKPRNELAHAILLDTPHGQLNRHSQRHEPQNATEGFLKHRLEASEKALNRCLGVYANLCRKLDKLNQLFY